MVTPTFALAIPHLPGSSLERDAAFARLQAALIASDDADALDNAKVFEEKKPNSEWSADMWGWGAQTAATHFLTLQDDVILHEDFAEVLMAMVTAKPDDVICLQTAHPAARAVAAEGGRWLSTADGLVGVAYCLPTALLREFLAWRAELPPETLTQVNEDTLLGLWCAVTRRRILHPIPSPIDHDTSIPSTYGNDAHEMRCSTAPVGGSAAAEWGDHTYWRQEPTHIGRLWDFDRMAIAFPHVTERQWAEYRADSGRVELRRLRHASLGRKGVEPLASARVMIATPTREGVHPEYAASIWNLLKEESVDCSLMSDTISCQGWSNDVVRVRSRFVSHFLQHTEGTHLLFLDADVAFVPTCIHGMLRAGVDFVAAPYPRRDSIDFARVRNSPPEVPAAAPAYKYSLQLKGRPMPDANHCVEIDGIGFGCMLLSRDMLERMTAAHPELAWDDVGIDGKPMVSTALFQLLLVGRKLYSEDYSFCQRAKALGYKLQMYLGPGSPIDHYGQHKYEGCLESFGLRRVAR